MPGNAAANVLGRRHILNLLIDKADGHCGLDGKQGYKKHVGQPEFHHWNGKRTTKCWECSFQAIRED